MPAIGLGSANIFKKAIHPTSLIDVGKGRNRSQDKFLKRVIIGVFMTFKTLFRGREKRRNSIRKELERFKDLLKKDKNGKILPRLKKEAVKSVETIRKKAEFEKQKIKHDIEACYTITSSKPLWRNALDGGIAGGTITYLIDCFSIVGTNKQVNFYGIAVIAAVVAGSNWLWHKMKNNLFVYELKALAPKIRKNIKKV
jgi:hypothetical protein